MKSNSLGRFRRRRTLKKFLIILCALAGGLIFAAEARFAVSRISLIEQTPADALPQYVLWGTIPSARERFWPLFWLHRNEYKELIEAFYPVEVNISLTGWGKFRVSSSPLVPVYRVYWGGRFWHLSAEGKLWLSSLAENRLIDASAAGKRPLLAWGADRATPIDMADHNGNVFKSSLPLARISRWYAQIGALKLAPHVKYVQAGVKEGSPVVRLILYKPGSGENGAQLLLPDDAEKWAEAVLAIKKLYGAPENMPPDILIDCTYKEKILLRNTGEGTKEGKKASDAEK